MCEANKLHTVPIGEIFISTDPADVLVVYGLGSCITVCLYDTYRQIGGMLHALLPGGTQNGKPDSVSHPTKFVDRGIPLLLEAMINAGTKPERLTTYLCGGAQVIKHITYPHTLNIGRRNIQAAQAALTSLGLTINAQTTGGEVGRTIKFFIRSGQVTVRTLGLGESILHPK